MQRLIFLTCSNLFLAIKRCRIFLFLMVTFLLLFCKAAVWKEVLHLISRLHLTVVQLDTAIYFFSKATQIPKDSYLYILEAIKAAIKRNWNREGKSTTVWSQEFSKQKIMWVFVCFYSTVVFLNKLWNAFCVPLQSPLLSSLSRSLVYFLI